MQREHGRAAVTHRSRSHRGTFGVVAMVVGLNGVAGTLIWGMWRDLALGDLPPAAIAAILASAVLLAGGLALSIADTRPVTRRTVEERPDGHDHAASIGAASPPEPAVRSRQEVRSRPEVGSPEVGSSEPGLARIGVGRTMEARLAEAGIVEIAQLAAIPDDDVDDVAALIGTFPGRLRTWVDAARQSEGHTTVVPSYTPASRSSTASSMEGTSSPKSPISP
jgi:predicted flap endonuclease-1-like 5' DNA nuclease